MSTQPYALTIAEAMVLLREKKLSPVELLDSVLQRIESTEDKFHAYTVVTAETAREAAKKAESEIVRGYWKGPLHGVPVALKDSYYTAGVPTEAGSKILRGFVPEHDSGVAARLKAGGATLVGKTVMEEFGYELDDPPPGTNPWKSGYWPGGSSVGSAVSVAADSAMGAMGTDVGGSIRLPGSMTGIAALKPTFGRVPKDGVIAASATMDHCGPLAKTVEDVALMMNVVAGYDSKDPTSLDVPIPNFMTDLDKGVEGLRLGIEREYFFYQAVTSPVRRAVESAISVLEEIGAQLVEVEIPYLEYASSAGLTIIMADASSYHQKWLRERAEDYSPRTRFMLELGELILATDYLRALQVRRRIKSAMKKVFEKHRLNALLTPTIPMTSMPADQLSDVLARGDEETTVSKLIHHGYPFNLTGQPALTVPCGFSSDRLPIGLQIVGRPFDELTVFRIGHAYESVTAWHEESPPI